jgi:glutathione S-transferase
VVHVPVMPARLVTIPISHYCEKARWALDRAEVPYREERHVQLVHRVASRRAGGRGTVPVLVAPEGVFAQSADILAYADRHTQAGARLYPRSRAAGRGRRPRARLRRRPRPRGPALGLLPHPPRRDLGTAYNCTGVPAWERRAFPLHARRDGGLHPPPVRHRPRDRRAGGAAVQRTFDAVAARLADGRRYLCGDAFTAADLAFAALAAPAIAPPQYGTPLPPPEEMPAEMAAGVRAFRVHPAGDYACRLFREER